ncbi:hypothetical protein KY347_06935 [Candidatus Woesearchaeota archaeon]|nr:hypothetical protein [Candidatus Woesearchaeota archaeon]
MANVEMAVSLKIPDNVAITAFNTLKRIGYNKLKQLERADYYRFDVEGNAEKFKKEISNTDILVNANKNKFSFSIGSDNGKKIKKINVLVQNLDNASGLLSTLRERLGFKEIKKLEKGVLWIMQFDEKADAENIAVAITKSLLMNENYQEYKVMK